MFLTKFAKFARAKELFAEFFQKLLDRLAFERQNIISIF